MRNTDKIFWVVVSILLLSACGGGDDVEEEVTLIQFIEPGDAITYVNNSEEYDYTDLYLTASVNGVTVYVQSDLKGLTINGSNNLLYFSEGVSVEDCAIGGNDNTAILPESLVLSCEITGLGNNGFGD